MESNRTTITSRQFDTLLLCIVVLFVSLCSYRLGQFMTADENYWLYERIPAYYHAWDSWKLHKTLINDKPGVTLALVAAPAMALYPDPYQFVVHDPGLGGGGERYDSAALERVLLAFRLPLVLFGALCLVLIALALRTLVGSGTSLIMTLGIATMPFVVGISRIMNPDTLLWSTSTVALLALLAWGQTGAWRWLLVGIAATSLALLSKYTAVFVIILAFGALVTQALLSGTSLWTWTRGVVLWLVGTATLSALLLPALFVRPQKLFDIFGQFELHRYIPLLGFGVLLTLIIVLLWRRYGTTTLARQLILWSARVSTIILSVGIVVAYALRAFYPQWPMWVLPLDLKDFIDTVNYNGLYLAPWQTLAWNASALLYTLPLGWLMPLVFSPFFIWRNTVPRNIQLLVLVSSVGILSYFAMLTLMGVAASPRYIVFVYPLSVLLAGATHFMLWQRLAKYAQASHASILLLLGCILWPGLSMLPHTYSYQNPLTPAGTSTSSHWGLGGYEAAHYLNSLPNTKDLQIWSDYDGVCEFIEGHCVTNYTYDQNIFNPDYYVLSKRGEERYMGRSLRFERLSGLRAYRYYSKVPAYQYCLDSNPSNCVRVYPVDAADRIIKPDTTQP
jgi:4-amino-4-deoxy-L-arabinose transferase-like glycosyltransferase